MWAVILCFAVAAPALLTTAAATPADVSHEDIRDAILSLVTIYRDNSDKLERHEYRERQLGEQLKIALGGLDKKFRSQDQIVHQVLDRIKSLEKKIVQKEEREQLQMLKIADQIDKMQQTLSTVAQELAAGSKGSHVAYSLQESPLEAQINARLDQISASLSDPQSKNALIETEKMVKNIEQRLENKSGASAPSQSITHELEQHFHILGNMLNLVSLTADRIHNLPQKQEIQEMFNSTVENMQEIREDLVANGDKGVAMLAMKLEEKVATLTAGQEDIMKTTTEVQSMAEGYTSSVSQSYDQLLSEVKGLAKVEQVMIMTADNVMDTKRRVEYGVHQILMEVGELVKQHSKSLNGTVNKRFDDIESTILDNQSGSLTNLTSKIETEISQVWRQIGIMYQQLTASATALDRLQQQTDAYVNGSVKTMDSMEGKVGMITSRMTEVDENLNFLLGRLSLVTSEYNQIKTGLSGALDNIRDSFLEVQSKLKDVGPPGPRPIAEDKDIGNDVPSG